MAASIFSLAGSGSTLFGGIPLDTPSALPFKPLESTGAVNKQSGNELVPIPEYRPPDGTQVGADGIIGGNLFGTPGQTIGSRPSDVLRNDITYASGYYPDQGIMLSGSEADRLGVTQLGPTSGLNPLPLFGTPIIGGGAPSYNLTQAPGPVGAPGASSVTQNVPSTGQTMDLDTAINQQINKELELLRTQGINVGDPAYGSRIDAAARRGIEIFNAAVAPERKIDLSGSGTPAAQGNKGFPLVIPIPGLDPVTAAALSIAGIVFSGGNVARFDPSNPLGSLAGAVQGTGQTIANVGNVITGQTGISTPTTTGGGGGGAAGAGTPSSGTGAGAQGTGEQSTNIGTTPIFAGGLGGGGGGAAATTPSTATADLDAAARAREEIAKLQVAQVAAIAKNTADEKANAAYGQSGEATQPASVAVVGGGGGYIAPQIYSQTGTASNGQVSVQGPGLLMGIPSSKTINQSGTANDTTTSVQGPGLLAGTPTSSNVPTTSTTSPTSFIISPMATGYTLPTTGTPAQRNLYQEATTTTQALGSPMQRAVIGMDSQGKPIYGNVPLDPATGQPMTVSQGIASGYGGLARGMTAQDISNLLQSIGAQTGETVTGGYQAALTRAANEQTAAANTALRAGNIADAESLFARAQALRTQANPQLYGETGALPQFTTAAQNQVARDVAALRQAEAGQLTQEQIRNAQQAAREAYGARGQVFSQGAAAQEVLNRANMIQQQQQLARQNLAQSMGQLGGAIGYQTANIFDPFATTLGQQYGMQTQNVGMNQSLYNQAMGLTSGAGGYGFAQQMVNPFSNYAQDVYSMNVNAINDAMNAAANRQAALEAAKMGQTGEYAKALGTLITTGGLGRIQSGLSSGAQGILDLLSGKWPGSTTTATPIT